MIVALVDPAQAAAGALSFMLLMVLLCLTYFGIYVAAVIHCMTRCEESSRTQWLIITILVPLGCVIYFFAAPRKVKEPPRI